MTAPPLLRTPLTMRRINDLIWESLDGTDDGADPVAFYCECAQEGCYLPVWLTLDEYERNRRRPDWRAVAGSHQAVATR